MNQKTFPITHQVNQGMKTWELNDNLMENPYQKGIEITKKKNCLEASQRIQYIDQINKQTNKTPTKTLQYFLCFKPNYS